MRFIKTLVFSIIFFILSAQNAEATSFPAIYEVQYDIDENGYTRVVEDIIITNETDNQYPSQYTLALEGIRIENVVAYDTEGPLNVTLEEVASGTIVTVEFDTIAYGRGKQIAWTLEYGSPDIAKKEGSVWEVTLPYVEVDEGVQRYSVTVSVAAALGDLDYSDPYPSEYERFEESRTLKYVFENPQKPISIVMAFGRYQIVDLELDYHIRNTANIDTLAEVALPPTVPHYQKIYLESLEPKPQKMYEDSDGNVLAQYKLSPNEEKDITFIGQAVIQQKTMDELDNLGRVLDDESLLLHQPHWDADAEEIRKLSLEIKESLGNHVTSERYARAVFERITNMLTYDVERFSNLDELQREGALFALHNPENVICTDYTDLTIALMRAGGIAAREVNGFAFTGNDENLPTVSDVLHAWVQIYLPEKGWVFVDPTWSSTAKLDYFSRFDTNHVAFVLKGASSEYPYPAGSYKLDGEDTDDVSVSFASGFSDELTPLNQWAVEYNESREYIDFIDYLFRKWANRGKDA